uniref:Uncharacterized protein n=1 Tax=Amphimedon queenslandica TaxID=400682 RepID=A0A1X7SFB6_AMPQE
NNLLRGSNIPLRVQCGGIDNYEFQFGWSILFGRFSLKAHGVYLLAQTTNERYYDHEWQLEKKLELKRQLVRRFEQLEGKARSTETQEIGIIARILVKLLIKLIRNIEISLHDVHVRIDDE